jgi:hypothetical protein
MGTLLYKCFTVAGLAARAAPPEQRVQHQEQVVAAVAVVAAAVPRPPDTRPQATDPQRLYKFESATQHVAVSSPVTLP